MLKSQCSAFCDTDLNPQPVAMQLKLQIKRNYLNHHWSFTVAYLVQSNVVFNHAFYCLPTEGVLV